MSRRKRAVPPTDLPVATLAAPLDVADRIAVLGFEMAVIFVLKDDTGKVIGTQKGAVTVYEGGFAQTLEQVAAAAKAAFIKQLTAPRATP